MPYKNKIPCPKCGKLIQHRDSRQCNNCRLKELKTRGFTFSHKKKLGEAKMANKNPMWRGEKVGYSQLHKWVKKRILKPELCQCCKKVPPMDLSNKGIYNRELKNWEWLCRRCHMKKDGRLDNFLRYKND